MPSTLYFAASTQSQHGFYTQPIPGLPDPSVRPTTAACPHPQVHGFKAPPLPQPITALQNLAGLQTAVTVQRSQWPLGCPGCLSLGCLLGILPVASCQLPAVRLYKWPRQSHQLNPGRFLWPDANCPLPESRFCIGLCILVPPSIFCYNVVASLSAIIEGSFHNTVSN